MDTVRELGALRPQLLRFALRRLKCREQAEDAVQETLLAALERIDRFRGGSSLGTWLVGILKHKIVDAIRASSRERTLDHDKDLRHEEPPEDSLARRRALAAVAAGLEPLPARAARVFLLRDVMGMDTAEVCGELGISASNCWVTHHRVRMHLRALPGLRVAADAL